VGPYTAAAIVRCNAFYETHQTCLRRSVGGHAGNADARADKCRYKNDGAATVLQHRRNLSSRAEKGRGQINGKGCLPFVGRNIGERLEGADGADIVDRDIEPPELTRGDLNQLLVR